MGRNFYATKKEIFYINVKTNNTFILSLDVTNRKKRPEMKPIYFMRTA